MSSFSAQSWAFNLHTSQEIDEDEDDADLEELGLPVPPPPPPPLAAPRRERKRSSAVEEPEVRRPIVPIVYEPTKKFALRAIQPGQLVQCNITRVPNTTVIGGYPTFQLTGSQGGEFIMAARRRKKSQTANYLIGTDPEDLSKDSGSIVAKVRALDQVLVAGKSRLYNIYTNGDNPKDFVLEKNVREELAFVEYEKKEWGNRGPLRMTASIPVVDVDGRRRVVKPIDEDDVNHLMAWKDDSIANRDKIVTLKNKEAKIRADTGAYVLDFGGRATKPSVKNIQLAVAGGDGAISLQFGKIDTDEFTLDVRYPLSPAQAFGICLSCFENNGHN